MLGTCPKDFSPSGNFQYCRISSSLLIDVKYFQVQFARFVLLAALGPPPQPVLAAAFGPITACGVSRWPNPTLGKLPLGKYLTPIKRELKIP